MNEQLYKIFLVNELARQKITITKQNYDEITKFIETPAGKENYKRFLETQLPKYISDKKYQGFKSTLRNLSDDLPKELIKDD